MPARIIPQSYSAAAGVMALSSFGVQLKCLLSRFRSICSNTRRPLTRIRGSSNCPNAIGVLNSVRLHTYECGKHL